MSVYDEVRLRAILMTVAVAVSIPPAIFLTVRTFIKGKGEVGSTRRWILSLRIALPIFLVSAIFALASLAIVLSQVGSYVSIAVSAIGYTGHVQARIFLFLALFEMAVWFVKMRNQQAASAHGDWFKHVGQFLALVLTALNITAFGLHLSWVYDYSTVRNIYGAMHENQILLSIMAMQGAFGLGVLVASIVALVKAKGDLSLCKASVLFVVAAALNFLSHLWENLSIAVVAASPYPWPEWMFIVREFLAYWATIISFGLLYVVQSQNTKARAVSKDHESS